MRCTQTKWTGPSVLTFESIPTSVHGESDADEEREYFLRRAGAPLHQLAHVEYGVDDQEECVPQAHTRVH